MCGPYFKAYPGTWNALSVVVTPEQGWKIFLACLNNEFTEKSGDPLVDAFTEYLSFNVEYDMEA